MFNWLWLLRVVLLGFTGTVALAAVSFSTGRAPSPQTSNPAEVTVPSSKARTQPLSPEPLPMATVPSQTQEEPPAEDAFNLQASVQRHASLFATPTSLGMLAIGIAEGNYRVWSDQSTIYVQQTPAYFGHVDPGNLSWGAVVKNYGPCSDQGRSGGNIALAEQFCLQRSRSQLATHLQDLQAVGINPDQDVEAVLNTADLYNQAKPIHSRQFPKALAIARQGGLSGAEALTWARTASFYLNANNEFDLTAGDNHASGLIGICARERRPITEWECVYEDQQRRVEAIAHVLEQYRLLAQQKQKAGSSSS
ncbi:MAG: hypothetical protein ACFB4I_11575 [Cyanophyceae cyanobacterium]